MASAGRHGRPEEEMFLQSPSSSSETPTVGPLRIQKRETSSSPQPGKQNGSIQHTFPLPPGASSSVEPLPYPIDRPAPQSQRPSDPGRRDSNTYKPYHPPPPATGPPNSPPELHSPTMGQTAASSLAQRRGAKNQIESPNAVSPDKDGLFAAPPRRPEEPDKNQPPALNPYPDFHQQYWPAPGGSSSASPAPGPSSNAAGATLAAPKPTSINRFSSSASTSTVKATRGSPPPPETPATGPGEGPASDIEARYAAAGIAGTATLTSLQAQGAAAAQRANQYGGQVPPMPTQQPGRRPWTPTEQPGSQPYGPPTVYQGSSEVSGPTAAQPGPIQSQQGNRPESVNSLPVQSSMEQDFQRMNMSSSPPPAYSSVSGPQPQQGFPPEKGGATGVAAGAAVGGLAAAAAASSSSGPSSQHNNHPAFANDPRQNGSIAGSSIQGGTPVPQVAIAGPAQALGIASPPPLPEGWLAHLDQNSGQYYYIHLPTQSTQWEFPKGPTPLNANETPLSPVGSVYSQNPLASPGISTFSGKPPLASPGLNSPGFPMTPGYESSIMGLATPSTPGYSGPPPAAGVDMYRVAPTNGVYFGPYLRYTNMDLEQGVWLGSILLVTDAPQPPSIHLHRSVDLSPNPQQLKASPIYTHQRWCFYRYDINIPMDDAGSVKWTYAITSHLGCTRYEFLVAGRHENNWRFLAHSGNDFSLNTNADQRAKLGGVGFMWKDIMQKHVDCGGFHCQLGLGDQIYADRIWKELPLLKQWLSMSGKDNRKNAPWTAQHEEDVNHAYFHYYTSHFDQPNLREAFAQIPHILQIDDHDIFDGFGSYPEYMQFSHMFKNIGRIGIEMYLLFQHHTTLEVLRNVRGDTDLFTITGTGWHFVKYLGPAVVVVGPDCRSERNPHQVMAGPTYQGLFPKVATLPPSVQHCLWMISVPIVYPRVEAVESIAHTVATGKKAVTGAYNVIGRVTSSVAGVVGAKSAVGEAFTSAKKAVGKSGLMGGILSPFGEIDMLDELRDSWTHESKDLERTYLIRTLQGIAHQKSLRMTFLSGDVNASGAGLLHDPAHPSDHKTMYQIISSSVVSAPPAPYILKLLHNNRILYVPANGHRTSNTPSDTKEDMMEIFTVEPDGRPREMKRLVGRRAYCAIVAFDPDAQGSGEGSGKLKLAVDYMVQGEGPYPAPTKYGPVVIPHLEFGR
ncbi:MAG: hypothetical protein M1814_001045 [Vezdaea aestivalis]|nr:MAG: hypothetical protein M1814_001045 [Vezdaea aestivalis]